MKIDNLRASTINTNKLCEWKYLLEIVCQFPQIVRSTTEKGSCVHLVMELMGKIKKNGHLSLNDRYCDPYYLLKICFERWKKKFPALLWGDEEWKFCTKCLKALLESEENPYKLDIIATEKQFEYDVFLPGFETEGEPFKLRGTMDLITKFDKDTIRYIDLKTGKNSKYPDDGKKTIEDFQKDVQLKFYDVILYYLYPEFPNRMLTMYYPLDGGPFTVMFSNEERNEMINMIRDIFVSIRDNKNPKRLIDLGYRRNHHHHCKFVCSQGQKYSGMCDKSYSMYKKNGLNLEKTTQQLIALTIGSTGEASRRNDYDRAGIAKGTII